MDHLFFVSLILFEDVISHFAFRILHISNM